MKGSFIIFFRTFAFQELDVSHKELEESGVRAEKVLRGETQTDKELSDADLMRTWFALLSEKNRLVSNEQSPSLKFRFVFFGSKLLSKLCAVLAEPEILVNSHSN